MIEPKIQENTHIEVKQEFEKLKFLGKLKHKSGLTCFEFNLKTRMVRKADVEDSKTFENGKSAKRLVIAPGCDYVMKLNQKNAEKYFRKKWK